MPNPVLFLTPTAFFLLGLIVFFKGMYPIRGTRLIVGRDARIIALSWIVPGVVMLIGLLIIGLLPLGAEQSQQSLSAFLLIVHLLLLGGWVVVFMTSVSAPRVDTDKPKRQPLPAVLTVSEVARYLQLEEIDVLNLIEDGDLKAKAIGGDYRISRAALQKYLAS